MGGGDMADDDSSDGVEEEVKMNIRNAKGSKFYVQVKLSSTVENFKSVVAQKCDIPARQQRLIYKGRIMKNHLTLRNYGLDDDHTVYLVRDFGSAAPADSTTTTDTGSNERRPRRGRPPFGPSFFPEFEAVRETEEMQQPIVHNPYIDRDILEMQNLMNNPETIRNMIMSNPQMRDIIDRNPVMARALNDPATLRRSMNAAWNTEIMRERIRNNDRALSNFESSPEGFNVLRRMYEEAEASSIDSSHFDGNRFLNLSGARAGRTGSENVSSSSSPGPENTTNSSAPNTKPLPNPWASADERRRRNSSISVNRISNTMAESPGGFDFPDCEGMDSMPDLTAGRTRGNLGASVNRISNNMADSPGGLDFPNSLPDLTASNQLMQNQELLNDDRAMVSQASQEAAQNDGGTGPPEELYATQLSQLREMGFLDTQQNIRALIAAAGNIQAAVDRLLGN